MHDPRLEHDDRTARDAALDVGCSFIVEAPAGSGKTELLIQRYLRLLSVVDEPEEILAITFTRKAAAEMQLRILDALGRAREGAPPREPHRQRTHSAASAALEKDRKNDWDLVHNPRRMRIQTMDAVNASIARSRPLTAGSGASRNVIADSAMRRMYRDAAALTLDQLAETGSYRDATVQVLRHVDNNTSLYIDYLASMLATRDQWLPFIGSGADPVARQDELRRRFESVLEATVSSHLERLHAALQEYDAEQLFALGSYAAEQLVDAGKRDHPATVLRDDNGVPETASGAAERWAALAGLLLTTTGSWRKTVDTRNGFPAGTGQRDAMLSMLDRLCTDDDLRQKLHDTRALPPTGYSNEQWEILLALFRLLPLAVTELKRLFGKSGVSDYIEVSLEAAAALGTAENPGDIALLLDYQLRHLLVDELQDTSTAQYRMLEALTGGWQEDDGRTLFCVGDPMQSIYRFRNAEVGQFLLARETGIGAVRLLSLQLRKNFRSGATLVSWFNTVFPDVLAERDDPREGAVRYSAAITVPELEGRGACVVHPVFGSSIDSEADTGCRVIRTVLGENPADQVAVLVRSRTQLPALLWRLRHAGVAYSAIEIDRLTDLPEIIDILALTRALAHRGDRIAWLALLRSPWAGLDWADLVALVKDAPFATIPQLAADPVRLATLSVQGRDAIARLSGALAGGRDGSRSRSFRERLEHAWLALGGPVIAGNEEAVDNVYRYLDVVERLELAGTLSDVARLEQILDSEHVSSDGYARLQVMTMHRAKGLQFDHVVLYGLGRTTGRRERRLLSWFDLPGPHGRSEKVISPVGPRADVENDPLHRFIERTEAAKDAHELGRLLYVACTRARQSLHLIGHVTVNADGDGLKPPRSDSPLGLLWPSVKGDFEEHLESGSGPDELQARSRWLTPVLRRFQSPWQFRPAETLSALLGEPASRTEPDPVEFYWVGSDARTAGTIVHRWLRIVAERRLDLRALSADVIAVTTRRWVQEMHAAPDSIEAVVARVRHALSRMGEEPTGRWLIEGEGFAELALTGRVDAHIEAVVLDRVRIDANGTHWIVDYKTSTHEGGRLQAFLQTETDRYRPQLTRYAALYRAYSSAPIRCALYFPLLGEFVEVDVDP